MEVYRQVFDYPHVRVGNLAHFPSATLAYPSAGCSDCEHNRGCDKPAADPPNTSKHVVEFMGWTTGKHPRYVGLPAGRVLDQEDKWKQLWLRKGRYEDERRRQRQAEEARVSAQEPSLG